ncbi:hypothetical protein BC834DRAFT_896311, partial [Gloeopeniophorella convolvens]
MGGYGRRCFIDNLHRAITRRRTIGVHVPFRHGQRNPCTRVSLLDIAHVYRYASLSRNNKSIATLLIGSTNMDGGSPATLHVSFHSHPQHACRVITDAIVGGHPQTRRQYTPFISSLRIPCDVRHGLQDDLLAFI